MLRLRQAQVALGSGRLDEAFELLRQPDMATHRAGQRLQTRLADALVKRSQQHLAAGRLPAAAGDANRAMLLAGNRADVANLTDKIALAQRDRARTERRHQELMAAAQAHISGGRLQLGAALLEEDGMTDVSRAQFLRQEIDARSATITAALAAARAATDRGQFHLAVDELCRARAAGGAENPDFCKTAAAASQSLRQQVQTNLEKANLIAASDDLTRHLQRLDPDHPQTLQLQTAVTALRTIWTAIAAGNYADARARLARVTPLLPSAKWLANIDGQLESAQRAAAALQSSPLACFDSLAATLPPPSRSNHTPSKPPTAPAMSVPSSASLPHRFVLHVDGIGSVLVIRSNKIRVGPVSASIAPDVAVVAEPSLPPICIERCDDDYFVTQPDGSASNRRLLTAGQRLSLSPRCRFGFSLPNSASTSAVLEFANACLARGADIRRVVLMDQDLVIGPGSSAHLPAPLAAEPIVLHLRDGQLLCRSRQPVRINDAEVDSASPLPAGQHLKIGELSLFVDRA